METIAIDFREFMKMVMIDCAEFGAWGMLYANEKKECPSFFIGGFMKPNDLLDVVVMFGERYHFYTPKYFCN